MLIEFDDIKYKYKRTVELTENELKACSVLYSNHYGKYEQNSKSNAGQKVRFPVSMYKSYYQKNNFFVAMAYDKTKLIAHAFYIRKPITSNKIAYFIVQLVVNEEYRNNKIATNLMRSIWGFSDCYAWGLITPNIRTVKTLESTTYRKCIPKIIAKHIDDIKKLQMNYFLLITTKLM